MRGDPHRAGKILAEDDGITGSEDKGRRRLWRISVTKTGGGGQRTADSGQRTAGGQSDRVWGRRGSAGGIIGYEK